MAWNTTKGNNVFYNSSLYDYFWNYYLSITSPTNGKIAFENLYFYGILSSSYRQYYSDQFYFYERNGSAPDSNPYCSTDATVMYASDYGYATDFRSCNEALYNYDNSACYSNDWLSGNYEWLLDTPPTLSDTAFMSTRSRVGIEYVTEKRAVRPTVMLYGREMIKGGNTGSKSDPYQLTA